MYFRSCFTLLVKKSVGPIFLRKKCTRSVAVIGAPFYKGQKWRGVEHGPAAIRNAKLIERLSSIGCDVYDVGDLHFAQVPNDKLYNNTVKYPRTVGLACQVLADEVSRVVEAGHTCVTLGGDHSLALGTISGHAQHCSDLCVIWVDAHADINTPLTTSSGNLHGQPVSFLLRELQDKVPLIPGFSWLKPCISTLDIVYIGLRDLDSAEQFILKKYDITYYSMRQIDCIGIQKVMERSFEQLLGRCLSRPSISHYLCLVSSDPGLAQHLPTATQLINTSFSHNTLKAYQTAWRAFNKFLSHHSKETSSIRYWPLFRITQHYLVIPRRYPTFLVPAGPHKTLLVLITRNTSHSMWRSETPTGGQRQILTHNRRHL
ncbi:arginase-2, mitochondrial isoform X1 [Lithobates pipiens]